MAGRRTPGARLSALLVVLGLLILPATAVAASQTATSTGGDWFYAAFGSGSGISGYGNDPDYGGLVAYDVYFVDPRGSLQGEGPNGSEADLRKTWASIVETRAERPAGGGNTGWLRNVRTVCSNFVNPDNYATDLDAEANRGSISFDISCDDGRGFDYYRVSWNGRVADPNIVGSWLPSSQWYWGSTDDGGWGGDFHTLGSGVSTSWLGHGKVTLCGHGRPEPVCTEGWFQWGYANTAGMHARADSDAPAASRTPIIGSDPIVGGNPED